MNVNKDTIENWEKTGILSYDALLKLAEYYRRSPTIFFNENKPEEYTPPPDFRTIDSKKTEITPLISFEIRSARNRRKNLLSLEGESDDYETPLLNLQVPKAKNPEEIAEIIRNKIGMNAAQMHLRKLEYWLKKIEELGILVFQFYDIKPKMMRGYALYYDKLPVIGINHREHPNGKKFSLFHELSHIITQKEGLSNVDSYSLTDDDEKFCNTIAAEILVPTSMLNNKIKDFGYGIEDNDVKWDDKKIKRLKNYFKVSPEVIVRRLLTLEIVSKEHYKEKKEEWNNYIGYTGKKYDKKDKNTENKIKKETEEDPNRINVIKASMALRRNGAYYTERVLSAYDSELITNSTMEEYLGETLPVIKEIRKKLLKEREK